jgi:uncharacterized protein (UPF0218 family)
MINNTIPECTEKTIWELMTEIERLKQENMELKIDNELLHNIIESQNDKKEFLTVVDGNEDLSYVDAYAQGFAEAESDYKF